MSVSSLHGTHIEEVACGPDFVVALDSTGRPWGWGRNDQGQVRQHTVFHTLGTMQ